MTIELAWIEEFFRSLGMPRGPAFVNVKIFSETERKSFLFIPPDASRDRIAEPRRATY